MSKTTGKNLSALKCQVLPINSTFLMHPISELQKCGRYEALLAEFTRLHKKIAPYGNLLWGIAPSPPDGLPMVLLDQPPFLCPFSSPRAIIQK
jgi:hypothetical protein